MKKFFISSLFMMNLVSLYAQTEGLVLNEDNIAINKANVYFIDHNILIETNEEGVFKIDNNIPYNSYILFTKHGYTSKTILYKEGTSLKVFLEKLHITLDEVGVNESINHLGNNRLTNVEKHSLSDVFLKSNSMLESISTLSGVDVISSGQGIQKIVVRGLSGMRVVTYLNGMLINNQQWANDHGIGFTDLGLSEVELIKGASALKYGGEAIGGLLYFKEEPFLASDRIKGFVATKFNNSSYLNSNQFGVRWNVSNFYFNLYGQYSISGDYRMPNNGYLFNSRFQQNAIKFSIAHRFSKWQNIFRYQLHSETPGIPGHIHGDPEEANLDDLTNENFDFSQDFSVSRPNQFVNNQLFVYESIYMINNLKFNFYAGHFINSLQEWEKWTRPAFDLTLSSSQLMPNIRVKYNDFTFNVGSQITILDNKNKIESRLVPDASSFNLGPYAIIDYEKENYGFNSGIRYDKKHLKVDDNNDDFSISYNKVFSSTTFAAGMFYKFNEHIFRTTYSGAYRAPHFSELFSDGVHHGTNRYELGDDKLNIEYANQLDFKYQWSNEHLGVVINPYIQHISDFISIIPTDSIIDGYKVYNYKQYDQVEIKGFEMNLHYHPHSLHNLHLEQSYSFLQTKNKDDKYGLAMVPANSIMTKALFDFSYFDKLQVLDYISLVHTHKFQQDIYAEFESITKSYNIITLQLGLKISKRINCLLSVNNLLNEEYTPHISRVRGVAGGIPNPGRFFSINLKYEF